MIVVDTSVALKWFIPEVGSIQACRLLGSEMIAPDLLLHELANIAWQKQRRGEIPQAAAEALVDEAPRFLGWLAPAVITAGLSAELAIDLDITAYDAAFLSLAGLLDVPFITADAKLVKKIQGKRLAHLVRLL